MGGLVFRRCFEDGLEQSLVSSVAQATDGRLFFCLFIYYLFSLCPTSDLLKQELISPGGRLLSWQLHFDY